MEKSKFYLPCPNLVDSEAPKWEGYYRTDEHWNGFRCPYFLKETFEEIKKYYLDEATNTAESIEDIKEWFEPSVAKSSLCISMHGNLYTIGSYCLAWGCEADD
tara:strand:- start:69 stop:377 length:309 start_codon:yes stop_codon:yes gene_type:complete